jgi:hypothetical protein
VNDLEDNYQENLKPREDWLKLGDDFVTDKIVQGLQTMDSHGSPCWPRFIEGYINRKFSIQVRFRSVFRDGRTQHFRAILYSAAANKPRAAYLDFFKGEGWYNSSHDSRSPMLVVIPETVEDIDVMCCNIISVVRLQIFNQSSGGSREPTKPSEINSIGGVFVARPVITDRESNSLMNGAVDLPQTPNDVIQNRTKVVDAISRDDPEAVRRLLINPEEKRKELLSSLRVTLGNHSERVSFEEGISFSSELVDVFLCPVEPEQGNFHVVHFNVPSTNAEEIQKEPYAATE